MQISLKCVENEAEIKTMIIKSLLRKVEKFYTIKSDNYFVKNIVPYELEENQKFYLGWPNTEYTIFVKAIDYNRIGNSTIQVFNSSNLICP